MIEAAHFEYFRVGYGLVTEYDQTTENCNLFYAQYLTLREGNMTPVERVQELNFFQINMLLKRIKPGLFNRRKQPDTRSTSHDEITGFMVASHILNTSHKHEIWKYLLLHLGVYNNNGRVYLPFNPGNFYAWGAYVKSPLRWLVAPIFAINMAISLRKPKGETSGKILYWLELFTMPEDWLNRRLKQYYIRKMTAMYGSDWLKELYAIYFNSENRQHFPLWAELEGYNGHNK